MSRIVFVHGIGQQLRGAETLRSEWLPWVKDGLMNAVKAKLIPADFQLPDDDQFVCAFYGDIFRGEGTKSAGIPPFSAVDITDDWEKDMLMSWWHEAAMTSEVIPGPDEETKASTPDWIQQALNALSYYPFFVGLAQRVIIWDLKQVWSYFRYSEIRSQILERLKEVISPDTQVVVGHSLGSVVAYEALCNPEKDWSVRTLVTLGSPLGIRNLIFDRLNPSPIDGKGTWPPGVEHWFNITDRGDVVALVKELGPLFDCNGCRITDYRVDNEATAHNAQPYLTSKQAGAAIAKGLTN